MADLAGALDAALRARYKPGGVKTPASQRRGLLARMNQIEKLHERKGDRRGAAARRAAEASNIPVRTWQKWRKGDYRPSAAGLKRIEDAYRQQITLPALRRTAKMKGKGIPHRVNVTAEVRWTNSPGKKYNSTKYRTVKLTGMGPTMVSVIRSWVRADLAGAAEAFERGASAVYRVRDDDDGSPGIQFEGDHVEVTFP